MAIQGPIPIGFDQVFPHGCYLVGEVQQVKDFDASTNGRTVYAKDKTTGLPVWQVSVVDADPEAKASQKSVTVKILTETQPVPPPALPGGGLHGGQGVPAAARHPEHGGGGRADQEESVPDQERQGGAVWRSGPC